MSFVDLFVTKRDRFRKSEKLLTLVYIHPYHSALVQKSAPSPTMGLDECRAARFTSLQVSLTLGKEVERVLTPKFSRARVRVSGHFVFHLRCSKFGTVE